MLVTGVIAKLQMNTLASKTGRTLLISIVLCICPSPLCAEPRLSGREPIAYSIGQMRWSTMIPSSSPVQKFPLRLQSVTLGRQIPIAICTTRRASLRRRSVPTTGLG
jgi:hypothetical protein